jgi:hypothetical protein
MAGRLLVGCFLSAALAFLLLVSSGGNVEATTYKVIYTPFSLVCTGPDGVLGNGDDTCTCEAGGAYALNQCSDLKTTFTIPATTWGDPDNANFARINTFHAPPEWGLGASDAAPIGSYAGLLYSNTTLSIANSPCPDSYNIMAPIPLYNCSTDNSLANQITWTGDGTNLTADSDADGIPDGCEKYPAHIDTIVKGRKPFQRLYGYMPIVAGSPPTQINFVVFQPGQLTADKNGVPIASSPDKDLGDSLGYSNQVIRDNPLLPELPQAITDFCTPLGTNTWLWGTSGGKGVAIPQVGANPELGIACLNWQGTNRLTVDDDADGTFNDGCWVVQDWCGDGLGSDPMCGDVVHHNPSAGVGGATSGILGTATHLIGVYTESYRDADNDGFANDVDACPYTAGTLADAQNGCDGCPNSIHTDTPDDADCPAAQCNPLDGDCDNDNYMNRQDRCPFVAGVDGADQVDNDLDLIGVACDTDSGTKVPPNGDLDPDGKFTSEKPRGAVCVGGTDTDGDGWCDQTEGALGSQPGNGASTPENLVIDYPVSSDPADPDGPGAAPGTCTDQTYYATAGDPHAGGVAAVNNDADTWTNAADIDCQAAAVIGDADQDGFREGATWQADIDSDATKETITPNPAGAPGTWTKDGNNNLTAVGTSGCWDVRLADEDGLASPIPGTRDGEDEVQVICPGMQPHRWADVDGDGDPDIIWWKLNIQAGDPPAVDNCPSASNVEQLNLDGDANGDACDTDDDADGMSDSQEWQWGYSAKNACSPFDLNASQTVDVFDILLYKPVLAGAYDAKFDLNQSGGVDVFDILLYKPVLAGPMPCPYLFG